MPWGESIGEFDALRPPRWPQRRRPSGSDGCYFFGGVDSTLDFRRRMKSYCYFDPLPTTTSQDSACQMTHPRNSSHPHPVSQEIGNSPPHRKISWMGYRRNHLPGNSDSSWEQSHRPSPQSHHRLLDILIIKEKKSALFYFKFFCNGRGYIFMQADLFTRVSCEGKLCQVSRSTIDTAAILTLTGSPSPCRKGFRVDVNL